ncbi:type IV secretory system conjugative DNA transfer family protein [Xanthomonas translucens]|uniref:type IV secretory system conjugative DNA transfer family protein n=1 Tax=Xanthomonas campestris pv. translucens TaxID=343 RepID=UPI001F2F92FB|nr:type IV secretory system conjugative DNA transfer family protein [Xanthomonas translucens]UJB14216.1 type IV secretory system conjugative DNA transfer family protein [Xanthomonas translucens pv. undulosa]
MGGLYFSDWLVLRLLGLKNTPLAWNTWLQYVQVKNLPQYAPFAGKIKLAGALGFGLPMLGWMLALVALFKPRAESTHGDARFADLRDLKKAGLLKQTPQSILIGKYKGRYLWLGGAQHVIAISPTRSGKTTSIAIPVLLSYMHSMVVLDLKGELHKATSGWRQAQGHRIRVWAPYNDAGMTHRFNPMTLLAWTTPDKRLGDIQTIAAILYPDEQGKDPFWTSQSRAAFSAFASYMFEAWDHTINELMAWKAPEALFPSINASPKFPSLERILRFSSGENGKSTLQMLQDILKNPKYTYISQQTRTVFGNLAGLAEQTFSSVIATMQAPLQQFLSPTLAAATNATDIDTLSLRKCPTTLYVIIPISISASYGVRDLCIVQSRAQLRSTYGDNDAQNFITNHGAQVVFAPREQSDANEYSEMLGYKTVRKQQRSRSSGGGASQISISYVEEKRALFLPQEIKELPSDDELIFYEGSKPILAQKNWFFKDKEFKARAAMPPARIKVVGHDAQMALPEHVIQVQNEKDVNRLS